MVKYKKTEEEPIDNSTIKGNLKSAVSLSIFFLKEQEHTVIVGKELYQYNGKHYEPVSDFNLGKKIFKFFLDNDCLLAWTSRKSEEMIKAVKNNPVINEVKFDDYDNLLNLNNGVLNMDTRELTDHSPDYHFSYCLDVDYDPTNKTAPTFCKFLADLFRDEKNEVDDETMYNILRIGGYLLYPKNKMESLIMFIGGGSNGKSLLIEIFKMFFDKRFLSSLSLSALSNENAFARSKLLNSRLNIATEQKGVNIDSEEIKKIVSGEDIMIDKKFTEPVNHTANTKLIVASNSMPYLNDTTYGTERRLFMVEFKNRFVSKQDYAKEENPQQHRIFLGERKDLLISKLRSEKTAILNLFLEGLKDLVERDWKLPETKNSDDIKEEYVEASDTLGHWIKKNYRVIDKKDDVENQFAKRYTSQEILDDFYNWYCENLPGKKFNYSSIAIAKKIKEKFRLDSVQRRIDGKNIRCYELTKKYDEGNDERGAGGDIQPDSGEAGRTQKPLFGESEA